MFPSVSVRVDKRATFRCTAGIVRPPRDILPGLRAAADYVAGPYPATLESATRSGVAAARKLLAASQAKADAVAEVGVS